MKLNNNIELIVVSKYHSVSEILKVNDEFGYTKFGENKAQDLVEKSTQLPQFKWYFIGNIQSNKLKLICKHSYEIQSVSKLKHLNIIQKYGEEHNCKKNVLLQLNLTGEEHKGGMCVYDAQSILQDSKKYPNICFNGIMVVGPTNCSSEDTFIKASSIFEQFKEYNSINVNIIKLSMGMSNDYELALKYKSNCLRIGSLIFNNI